MISGNGNLKRALSATTRPSAPAQRVATFGEEVPTAQGLLWEVVSRKEVSCFREVDLFGGSR